VTNVAMKLLQKTSNWELLILKIFMLLKLLVIFVSNNMSFVERDFEHENYVAGIIFYLLLQKEALIIAAIDSVSLVML
jgi:hypothetical protein